jgi:D-alanyl-D-alanine carboxypeptidase/D-alanyl-D-alanine-endopeptidase (penicillin-binding protein 4)
MLFFAAAPSTTLDQILDDPRLAGAVVSACVESLDGDTLFERNPGAHMTPASNQKLLSNAYALWKLGPDYRPQTRFWKRAGRVIVDSPGDPLLGYNQVVEIRRRLKLSANTLVQVREAYRPGFPEGWEWDDLPNKYAAPITSFSVNQAAFELWSKKGKVLGVPSLFGNTVVRGAVSGPLDIRYDPILRRVYVNGKLPTTDVKLDTLSVSQPDIQAAKLLGSRMEYIDSVPAVSPDATITGKTVRELVEACLPPSDNNIAEHLLLMAALRGQQPTQKPYILARKSIATFMNSVVGTAKEDTNPQDGSGLSRHNFVTTRAITHLLRWADRQPTRDIWRGALATPGKGTLKSRLLGTTFQGKTGTLDMVVALSGYVKTSAGNDVAVSVIINQFGGSSHDARDIADAFVSEVAHADLDPQAN